MIDKFHVIKHLMDALKQVRRQLKTQCLNNEKTLITSTPNTEDEKVWTTIALLERSRYILFKMQGDWEEDEKEMMAHLFNHYFKEGQTNAKAENMNGKIQRFLANNLGIKTEILGV